MKFPYQLIELTHTIDETSILLSSGRYIVENIANSEHLPSTGSFVMAFPLKIRQATEAPMRLFEMGDIEPQNHEMPDLAVIITQVLLKSQTLFGEPPEKVLAPIPYNDFV